VVAISQSGHERNHLFLNEAGRYRDVSGLSGLDDIADSRGFALLDYDRDGDSDIALVNTNAPLLELFRNDVGSGSESGGFVAIRFVGGNRAAAASEQWSNRDGYGAQVKVHLGERVLVREHRSGEGFATQNSKQMLVGLGGAARADRVAVRWPSGVVQETRDVAAGTELVFTENPVDAAEGRAVARLAYRRTPVGEPDRPVVANTRRLRPARLDSLSGPEPETGAPSLRLYTTMATWCPACKRNIPQVRYLRTALPAATVRMYGLPIDGDDTLEMLAEYDRDHRPGYALLTGATPAEVSAAKKLVRDELADDVLPTTIVTDGSGRVLEIIAGVPTLSQVRMLLRAVGSGA
jgi:hypothetical protein